MRNFLYALAAVVVAGMVLAAIPADAAVVHFDPGTMIMAGCLAIGADLRASTALSPVYGPVIMAAKSIEDLEADLAEILAQSQAIVDKADEESDGEVSEDDLKIIEANTQKADNLKRQIEARKSVAAITAAKGAGRTTSPEITNANDKTGTSRRVAASPKDSQRHNFQNLGEFALSVRAQKLGDFENDGVRKLMNAATTYGNEGTGADGGFLVPPDFANAIWKKVEAEENLMSRCVELTPEGNSMTIPKDETTPWGTSGIRVYWEPEAAQATQSKGSFESDTLRLYKLMALAPVSDEMLEDARGFESWLMAKVPGIMSHTINTAIVSGNGAGKPLGILSCITGVNTSVVSVAKETSQPADSIWKANIDKMWGRLYAPWRRNAVWLINQDAEPALEAMGYSPSGVVPTAASMPVYLPPGGVSEAPYARLKGRPVIPLQACKTVGDQGDIILVDFNQYLILRKAAGLRSDTSIHLYFDQAVTAFRFVFRINGQPAWSTAITPENSSNTLSWAVVLDAR